MDDHLPSRQHTRIVRPVIVISVLVRHDKMHLLYKREKISGQPFIDLVNLGK